MEMEEVLDLDKPDKKKIGRPKGSKNKPKENAGGDPSVPPAAKKSFSDAVRGESFGENVPDTQEVFQIRILKPDVKVQLKDVVDYFQKTKHGRSLFGLQRSGGDLIASFHSKDSREDLLRQKVLTIGQAEVRVAPHPAQRQDRPGTKYIVNDVPMEVTGPGLRKALHPLNVDRFILEKIPGTKVRTGRAIFWATADVPGNLYIAGKSVKVKKMGLPPAPPNTVDSSPATQDLPPKSERKVEEHPSTPTHQAQKEAANLAAGKTPKRKDISPLATHVQKKPKSTLESEAPLIDSQFIKDLGLQLPKKNAVLSIYEDVTDTVAKKQNEDIPSPLGKDKKVVKKPHATSGSTEDWFAFSVHDGTYDEDAIFHYEGSYTRETSNMLYLMMRWVQRLVVGEGIYVLVLFKSRIYLHRNRESLLLTG